MDHEEMRKKCMEWGLTSLFRIFLGPQVGGLCIYYTWGSFFGMEMIRDDESSADSEREYTEYMIFTLTLTLVCESVGSVFFCNLAFPFLSSGNFRKVSSCASIKII
jgi:hypothetical protein